MPIEIGSDIPHINFKYFTDGGLKEINSEKLFKGRNVVLFGLPGAFSPTCSEKQLPDYIAYASDIKAENIDIIICMAVNDPFVMSKWGKASMAGDAVFLLPDGNGELTRKLDLEIDASAFGLGKRCDRFSMLVKDGVVETLNQEEPGKFEKSSAEFMLKYLKKNPVFKNENKKAVEDAG